jgi:hypothetical protein
MTLSLNDGEEGMPQAFAKSPLNGDFDIAYDYDLRQIPSDSGLKIIMLAFRLQPDQDAGEVEIRREDVGQKTMLNFATEESEPVTKPTTGTSGRIRVQRMSSHWIVSQWSDNSWQTVGKVDNGPSDPVYPGFVLNRFGSKQPMLAVVTPAQSSGAPRAGVNPPSTETQTPPGTLVLEDIKIDMGAATMRELWQNSSERDGTSLSTWNAPWGTVVYSIQPPKQIPSTRGATIRIEIDDRPKPGQGFGTQASFPDSDFTREPLDRELQVNAQSGQRATGSKDWRITPYYGDANNKPDHMSLLVWLGDGPHYTFRYRVVK